MNNERGKQTKQDAKLINLHVMPLQRPKADFVGLQKNAVVISA